MQTIDYAAVIEDIEQKRAFMNAKFDAALAAIRQVIALNGSEQQPVLPGVTLPQSGYNKPYRELPMQDAAIRHIRSVGHAVPNLALAKALEQGGYEHKSKNFPNTLNSILWRRVKTIGDIRKTARGWDVVEKGVSLKPTDSVHE